MAKLEARPAPTEEASPSLVCHRSAKAERKLRMGILRQGYERLKNLTQSFEDPADPTLLKVARRSAQIAPNLLANVQSLFSPLAMLLNTQQIKDAAHAVKLFEGNTFQRHQALDQFLLALVDGGISAACLVAPVYFGAAGSLLAVARAISSTSQCLGFLRGKRDALEPITKFADLLLTIPGLEKALITLAHGISYFEVETKTSLTNMKLLLSKDRKEADKLLVEFHEGYVKEYPPSQQESLSNMRFDLANDPRWNVHVVNDTETGKVIGGFTTFCVRTKDGVDHLILEQLYPSPETSVLRNAHVWEVIQSYARELGVRSIWTEIQETETPAPGFKVVNAPHGQPAILGRATGDTSLRMSVWLPNDPADIPAELYRSVVVDGWLKHWAHPADPIFRRLEEELPKQGMLSLNHTLRVTTPPTLPPLVYDERIIHEVAQKFKTVSNSALLPDTAYSLSLRELAAKDPSLARRIIHETYAGFVKAFPFESQRNSLEQMYSYLDQSRSDGTDFQVILTKNKEGRLQFAGAHISTSLEIHAGNQVGFVLYAWSDERMRRTGFGRELFSLIDTFFATKGISKIIAEVNDPDRMSAREKGIDSSTGISAQKREVTYQRAGYQKLGAYYEQGAIQAGSEPCKFLTIWCKGFERITRGEFDELMREIYLGDEPWDHGEPGAVDPSSPALDTVEKISAMNDQRFGESPSVVLPFVQLKKLAEKKIATRLTKA